MVYPVKFTVIIYVLVFILAKLFHCIDVSNESAFGADATVDTAGKESTTNASSVSETSLPDQTTKLDSTAQPLPNGNVMQICNQTFPTPKEYLIELNSTGTLPDEIDEIATCFIRCYLEKMEILKNDNVDHTRAIELDLARNEDILDDCSKESRDAMSAPQFSTSFGGSNSSSISSGGVSNSSSNVPGSGYGGDYYSNHSNETAPTSPTISGGQMNVAQNATAPPNTCDCQDVQNVQEMAPTNANSTNAPSDGSSSDASSAASSAASGASSGK